MGTAATVSIIVLLAVAFGVFIITDDLDWFD